MASSPGTVEVVLKAPEHEVVDVLSDEEEFTEDDVSDVNSLTEDVIEILISHDLSDVHDACTAEESLQYRRLLHDLGPHKFLKATMDDQQITAKKLLTAFSIRPPDYLEGADDDCYYGLLGAAIKKELHNRIKLDQYNSVDDAVELLRNARNIVVLTGAGISTSLGIPDFRSMNDGLYTKLRELGRDNPEDVFNIEVFREDPQIFYQIAKEIMPPRDGRFTPTHAFIRLLQDKGKLLTNYTQNIDNIEASAGIEKKNLVQCHGSFAAASCIKCNAHFDGSFIVPDMQAGTVARCPDCMNNLSVEAPGMKRKRSSNGSVKKRQKRRNDSSGDSSADDDLPEAGAIKPDIVFFGEALPDTFANRLTEHDKDLADLVLVIGTSLKVAPVSEIIPYLAKVPQLIISRDRVQHLEFDIEMLGDCDVVVAELCRRLEWDLKHEMVPQGQKVDVSLLPHPRSSFGNLCMPIKSAHVFKVLQE